METVINYPSALICRYNSKEEVISHLAKIVLFADKRKELNNKSFINTRKELERLINSNWSNQYD